ncbi:universal stress protein [Aestuariibius sp. HNIBRBA575]|uniref:universal stress protein n=1 Tax=Aestuariibius sp. HNIBRBA575 TaxID=3233343 RepID=UPI0034A58611
MGYKSVSIIVTDQATDAAPLASARAVADRCDGHLDVHCLGVDPARYEPLPAGSAAIIMETGVAEARAQAGELVDWVNAIIPQDIPNVAVEGVIMPHLGLDSGIGRIARYSDLIVCAKPYGKGATPLQVSVLEAALFGTRAPVLVCNSDAEAPVNPRRILLAWDESAEALSAMRYAMPLMQAADRVDVVMVDPPSHSPERSDPGGAVTLMLARHGVRAEVSILSRTLPRVSECLSRFAKEHNCDMIVMGAYGHSRLREAVLGGPTRDMLEQSEIPLFMAH